MFRAPGSAPSAGARLISPSSSVGEPPEPTKRPRRLHGDGRPGCRLQTSSSLTEVPYSLTSLVGCGSLVVKR